MSSSITITGSVNAVSGQTNQFQTFIPQGQDFNGQKVAMSSLAIAYCWPNINNTVGQPVALRSNGNFSYIWPNGAGFLTYTVTAPTNSFWEITDLNAYLQSVMVANKTYLIDSSGNPVYFISIQVNQSRYGVSVNITPVPTSLGTYTMPASSGWSLPTGSAATPSIIVPGVGAYNNGTFGSFIGFVNGTYPPAPQSTFYSAVSSFPPTVSPVSTIIVTSNLCDNKYNANRNVIFSFTPSNTGFGEVIVQEPLNTAVYYNCRGQTNIIQLNFYDQNWQPLNILDPVSMTAVLTFKPQNEQIKL